MSAILFGNEGAAPAQAEFTGPADDPEFVAGELFSRLT
jgi:hypothetical protein